MTCKSFTSWARHLLVPFLLFHLSGCGVLILGGAAAGTVGYVSGDLTATLEGGFEKVVEAADSAISDNAAGAQKLALESLPSEQGAQVISTQRCRSQFFALARGPSVAIDLARRFIHKSLDCTLDEMIDYEAIAATLTSSTKDAAEATQAFLQKRKPEFKGH